MTLRVPLVVLLAAAIAGVASPRGPAAEPVAVQQISSDTTTDPAAQHAAEVEPDSFAFGNKVVAAFQVGRFFDGGADGIGFSTSADGGQTWTSGLLPFLTQNAAPAGGFARASDPTVAYDSLHGVWLVATLALGAAIPPPPTGGAAFVTSVEVSRSSDGVVWLPPANVGVPAPGAYDKEWIACDNGATSPLRGHCYVSYTDFSDGLQIATSTSVDGGATWGPAVKAAGTAAGVGTQIFVEPDGSVVVPFRDLGGRIAAVRSADGGASFGPPFIISNAPVHAFAPLRAGVFPSGELDAAGTIYLAWPDCSFRAGCPNAATDIVFSTSADGISWNLPRRVPIDDPGGTVDHLIPGLAVDPTTSGAGARIAIAYYTRSSFSCSRDCTVGAGFIGSADGGATWSEPRPLSTQPMTLSWFPDTTSGRMLADYISTSFVAGGYSVPVLALAAPFDGTFHQGIFAARVPPDALGPAPLPQPTPPPPPALPEPTPSPSPPPVANEAASLTAQASRLRVVYGGQVTLSGSVSSGQAGESVTIGGAGTVTSRDGGTWSFDVQPGRSTTYLVSWSTATPVRVLVAVQPRVVLTLRGNVLTVRVVAARSLAGARIVLERRRGGGWAVVARIRLARGSRATVQLSRAAVASGLVRVAIPASQDYAATVASIRVRR